MDACSCTQALCIFVASSVAMVSNRIINHKTTPLCTYMRTHTNTCTTTYVNRQIHKAECFVIARAILSGKDGRYLHTTPMYTQIVRHTHKQKDTCTNTHLAYLWEDPYLAVV